MIIALRNAPAHAEIMFGSDKKWGLRIWAVWCYSGNWVYHTWPLNAFSYTSASGISNLPTSTEQGD